MYQIDKVRFSKRTDFFDGPLDSSSKFHCLRAFKQTSTYNNFKCLETLDLKLSNLKNSKFEPFFSIGMDIFSNEPFCLPDLLVN